MSALAMIILVGVGTYAIRASGIVLFVRSGPPPQRVEAALRLIAPAVLAAIVADQLFVENAAISVRSSWLIATAVVTGLALRRVSPGLSLLSGLVAVWAAEAVL